MPSAPLPRNHPVSTAVRWGTLTWPRVGDFEVAAGAIRRYPACLYSIGHFQPEAEVANVRYQETPWCLGSQAIVRWAKSGAKPVARA